MPGHGLADRGRVARGDHRRPRRRRAARAPSRPGRRAAPTARRRPAAPRRSSRPGRSSASSATITQARGNADASAEISAPVTSAGAAASPSDCESSSQRRMPSRSLSSSRRERTIAQPISASTTSAAMPIATSSITSARRADAKTELLGRSITIVQPGSGRVRVGDDAVVGRSQALDVRQHAFALLDLRRRAPCSSGCAKLASVSCWPARSSTTIPSKPRSIARLLVRDGLNSIEPARTPVMRPARVAGRHRHHHDLRLADLRGQPLADERLPGDRVLEVRRGRRR